MLAWIKIQYGDSKSVLIYLMGSLNGPMRKWDCVCVCVKISAKAFDLRAIKG